MSEVRIITSQRTDYNPSGWGICANELFSWILFLWQLFSRHDRSSL